MLNLKGPKSAERKKRKLTPKIVTTCFKFFFVFDIYNLPERKNRSHIRTQ